MDTIDNHEPQKIQNRLWFIFSSYFIFFIVLVFLGIYSILSFNRYQEVDDLKRESTSLVKTLNERILKHFTSIRSDLLFLPKLNEMLRFKELNDGDDKEEIEREFLEFAKTRNHMIK